MEWRAFMTLESENLPLAFRSLLLVAANHCFGRIDGNY
jgi:hypothetical protein